MSSITALLTKLKGISTDCARKKAEFKIIVVQNWDEFKNITSLKCLVSKLAVLWHGDTFVSYDD